MRPVKLLGLTLAILATVIPATPSIAQTPTPVPTITPTPQPTVAGLTVTGVTPATGSAVSPTQITVNGTGFTPGSTVVMGNRALPATFIDAGTLRVTVPLGMPIGPYPVSVSTTSGTPRRRSGPVRQ